MMNVRRLLCSMLFFALGKTYAQVDNNTASYRNIGSDKYFRVHYDNDFFTNSDYYYTQGISLELVTPALKKNPLNRLLVQPAGTQIKYGLAINDLGYTPTSISSNEILYGDRPFAATIYLKTFAIATDTVRRRRISSALSTGVIGPAAQGKEMQTGIHRWLNNITPRGWEYQIKNDVVLNYQVNYEQQIVAYKNLVQLSAGVEIQAGTLKDKLSSGCSFMLGKFNNPYAASQPGKAFKKHFNIYLYGAPQLSLVGYDASLQGGLFNRKSPYTIPTGDIERITFQANVGLVVTIGKLHMEYNQSYLTKEFRTGNFHRWAGLKFGFLF